MSLFLWVIRILPKKQNANKNLQGIEENIMKEILIFLIFALAVFAAILINEGR